MSASRPVDVLKTALSTLVLVSGAIGSVVNLLRGNSIPFAISLTGFLLIVLIVLSEVRAALRESRAAAAQSRRAPADTAALSGAACPDWLDLAAASARHPEAPEAAADGRVYLADSGAPVIRLVALEPAEGRRHG